MFKFPIYLQTDAMTCGPTCLRMILHFYGEKYLLDEIVAISGANKLGVSMLDLSNSAENFGLKAKGASVNFEYLLLVKNPFIVHWNSNHFVVVYKITKSKVFVADPAYGRITYNHVEFKRNWIGDSGETGIAMFFDYIKKDKRYGEHKNASKNVGFLQTYYSAYKSSILQLLIGLIAGTFFQLLFPFLTQGIIDVGVKQNNVDFIYLVLLAQLMIFLGKTTIDIIRSYILLQLSARISISLTSDFFAKLMRLPIRYYDSKMTGDILQRIADNQRIESFLTSHSLNTLFSMVNFIVFSIVLCVYSFQIFLLFLSGTILYFAWILLFFKKRAAIDYKRFNQGGISQGKTIELISGMQEIKLNNAEDTKRWNWEKEQVKLFHINLSGLSLSSMQSAGSGLINELKNIIITFWAAKLVIDGDLTLGMMLSVSYIIGQINVPVADMVNFIQHWQDASLSLERLNEIHKRENEESDCLGENIVNGDETIVLRELSFSYDTNALTKTIDGISLAIPAKKVTAIVGSSGSGKTTLLKLLLHYYKPDLGSISIGVNDLQMVSPSYWRSICGVVMQEGFIFNDTIANNIAVKENEIDLDRLVSSCKVANIDTYIKGLPLQYNTKIGSDGMGMSSGQKQRILIARAIYKNPKYLFFDEATSALDTNNESAIMDQLNEVYKGKTVLVIAHRLSTVKNADQIIVMDRGKVVEIGKHDELLQQKGYYYNLVKNQLELDAS